MTPEQAHFVLHEVYIPQIRNEHQTTRRVIESVPADKLSYAPDPKSMDAWTLATHIASSEMFFMRGTAKGAFDRADGMIPESVKTPADLGVWYAENHAAALEKLAEASGDHLVKIISFAVFSLPAIAYTGLMIGHSIHHRGQLSAYLRPMGAKVPRIYGGSADEPIVMPQQQAAS